MIKVGVKVSMNKKLGVISDTHIDNNRSDEREFKVDWDEGGQSWELEKDLKVVERHV